MLVTDPKTGYKTDGAVNGWGYANHLGRGGLGHIPTLLIYRGGRRIGHRSYLHARGRWVQMQDDLTREIV